MNTLTILKALSNQKRLDLLQWLKEPAKHFPKSQCGVGGNEVCVGLIEKKLKLSQSTASKYLSQLQRAGLVTARRHGQWTYYRYNKMMMKSFIKLLTQQHLMVKG